MPATVLDQVEPRVPARHLPETDRRKGSDAAEEVSTDAAAAVFQVVLAATQARTQCAGGDGCAPYEQMFEAPAASQEQDRNAVLKDEFQAAAGEQKAAIRRDSSRLAMEPTIAATEGNSAFEGKGSEDFGRLKVDPSAGGAAKGLGRNQGASKNHSVDCSQQAFSKRGGAALHVSSAPSRSELGPAPFVEGQAWDTSKQPTGTDSTVPLVSPGQGVAARTRPPTIHSIADQVSDILNTPRNERAQDTSNGPASAPRGDSQRSQRSAADARGASARGTRNVGQESKERTGAEAAEPTPFDRLLRSLRVRSGLRQTTARVRLDPPELGRMSVDVQMDRDSLRIEVRTENEAASELIRERAESLRASLQQHGLRMEQFDVRADLATVGTQAFGSATGSKQGAESWNDAATRRREGGGPSSGGLESQKSETPGLEGMGAVGGTRRLDIRV